ncbi:MAG TPA: hypothetical protein VMU94_13005 [Streptosporangiaceae bacterium]|nr:hypothetical protein [Streptosporangiaceae bacterium]
MADTEFAGRQSGETAASRSGLRRVLVSIGIANAALYALYVGVLQVLLPLQVEAIDRPHKVAVLGLVSGVSAIFAAAFNPIGGALSDRTRTRFGRRSQERGRGTRHGRAQYPLTPARRSSLPSSRPRSSGTSAATLRCSPPQASSR